MSFVPRVMALLLMGGMLLPSWAMRDCCCTRKTVSTVRPCCAKRLAAAAAPLRKCCAARLKKTPAAVQSDHGPLCRCVITAPTAADPTASRRVIDSTETPTGEFATMAPPRFLLQPVLAVEAHPQPPPLRAVSSQIALCRWRV
ncbi:MAG TPA: hypothetical protein VFG20_02445 [Planctomycetaceae bacterium]|nr:hypothetical protein [Planctomycetaceae bacterium]